MPSRITLLALIVAFAAVACAPPALDPEHSSGTSSAETSGKSKSKKSSKDTADDDDDTTADDTTKTSKQATNGGATTAPASFSAVYTTLKATCASCHLGGASGAPTFFGDTEAKTYDSFVNQSFNTSPSPLVTKGAHAGPALTPEEKSDVEAWVADEKK